MCASSSFYSSHNRIMGSAASACRAGIHTASRPAPITLRRSPLADPKIHTHLKSPLTPARMATGTVHAVVLSP